jgi:DNA-directed RNA polymerase specialized sigma24 family protein
VSHQGSVSRWLGPLKEGDPAAAEQLWQVCFVRLVELARKRLRQAPMLARDEEDVALSVFDTFCRNIADGRFPRLADRDDLWRVLATITARKASHVLRDEGRQKRGGGAGRLSAEEQNGVLEQIFSREPSPELAAQMTEAYERLLDALADDELRRVAVWRMEGHTVEEIAAKIGCVPRSVKRKLAVIRNLWESEELA